MKEDRGKPRGEREERGVNREHGAAGLRRTSRQHEPSPLTLGRALAARVRLIVWCKSCGYQVEPDSAQQAERYGEETTVIDWAAWLRCSKHGGSEVDFVVSGARR
jgi:hypothetical protein